MNIRKLNAFDAKEWKEFLEVRKQLGGYSREISRSEFIKIYDYMTRQNSVIFVGIVDKAIVATAKLNIETKWFDNVAIIEDVVVHQDHRKRGFGKEIVSYLVEQTKARGDCYKIIVLTKDNLEHFYNESGLSRTGISMSKYF